MSDVVKNQKIEFLKDKRFVFFQFSEFLGILNDNVYRTILSFFVVSLSLNPETAATAPSISLVGAIFILPYLLFSGYAGFIADRFNKRTVILLVKLWEIGAFSLGTIALYYGQFWYMLSILFLTATQSTFSSPVKFGILPEILHRKDIPRVNGVLGLLSYTSIILGGFIAGWMSENWSNNLIYVGYFLIISSSISFCAAFFIPHVKSANTKRRFPLNPWKETIAGIKQLIEKKKLGFCALGSMWFWFAGALIQLTIILYGKKVLFLTDFETAVLNIFTSVGIGIGCAVAGRVSRKDIAWYFIPVGLFLMIVGLFFLGMNTISVPWAKAAAFIMGLGSGAFIVPINSFMQLRPSKREKGKIIAAGSFIDMTGTFIAAALLYVLHDIYKISPDKVFLFLSGFGIIIFLIALEILFEVIIKEK